jgi:hypothetical protein
MRRPIGVDPLADIVAPADGLAATACALRIGVDPFAVLEPARPRTAAEPGSQRRMSGVGPEAADAATAAAHHIAAASHDAWSVRVMLHIVHVLTITLQQTTSKLQ